VYLGDYSGHLYCLDGLTGKTLWTYFVGETSETPYNSNPVSIGCIADGKVYCYVSDVYQPDPRYRGYTTFAVDANSGKLLWSVNNTIQVDICADGYLIGGSWYDGAQYCFGKGQTATTVQSSVTSGNTVLVEGTVMDMSPAQPNTPAVSNASMDAWMDYLHFQQPMPTNVQGVPVLLTATASNGSTINIGTVTSDGYGCFAYDWTPPSTGMYKVQATFAGSDAYYSSTGQTAIVVSAKASATPTGSASPTVSASVAPAPSSNLSAMTIYVAIAAAVIIIVIIAVALVLRRR
jgi:outer membrane protein assembly factor BamB